MGREAVETALKVQINQSIVFSKKAGGRGIKQLICQVLASGGEPGGRRLAIQRHRHFPERRADHYQSGGEYRRPFQYIAASDWNGSDPNLNGSKAEKLAQWFNRSAFSLTPAFAFGNAPHVMPNLRMDGEKNFDLSLFKNNYFNEGKWNPVPRRILQRLQPGAVRRAQWHG
jgi:hypothetical protein